MVQNRSPGFFSTLLSCSHQHFCDDDLTVFVKKKTPQNLSPLWGLYDLKITSRILLIWSDLLMCYRTRLLGKGLHFHTGKFPPIKQKQISFRPWSAFIVHSNCEPVVRACGQKARTLWCICYRQWSCVGSWRRSLIKMMIWCESSNEVIHYHKWENWGSIDL